VRYDLWDAFFSCRFEFDEPSARKRKDAVLQYNRGEYGLNINAWEADAINMELGWNYYKANEVSLILNYRNIASGVDADINPQSGRRISLELTRAWNNLHSGAFEYNFKPLYDHNDFGRYYLHYEEYMPLPLWSHSLSLFVKGGMIDKKEVDDFFNLFLGSRDGMRGYSYYSMGGKKNAMARLTYRFPIWRNINTQLISTYFGSLYGAVFAEAGKAWDEDEFDLDHNMKDAGFEIRMKGFSFYHYPLAISFEGAYGFNEIKYVDPFIEGRTTYEGKEWKYYGTVFFEF
jgi:outer membrane protein assembly factor BamA